MALSNKEKVGKALDAVGRGLRPFVDRQMSSAAPAGRDWVEMLAARDGQRHGVQKQYSVTDTRFLLKVLTEESRVFGGSLSHVDRAYVTELRNTGNRWAHENALSTSDASRALDTAERLLTAIGAPDEAGEVQRLRLEHERTAYEEQTRKVVRAAVGSVSTPGIGLKPWREIMTPHADVAAGQFNAAEFAADLHQVATGQTTQSEYAEPRQFFARTFLTEGLKDLLDRVARRMSGDTNASPVVNLQTNFGGGKTHSMLAAYHLCSGLPASAFPQEVQDVVGEVDLGSLVVRRVALVGTHLAPQQPRVKPDGTQVRTLWGELAWQLGGRAAYDALAEADRTGTPPGSALADLLRAHAPVLILIDEWVAYARGLSDDETLAGGRFDSQFTFAQGLTEAVSAIPGAMLLVSIPASDNLDAGDPSLAIEVGGERGRRALLALQNVVGRKADHWRPANSIESFEIVRRRLFAEPTAEARIEIAAVARQVVGFYRENHGQFPREAEEPAYEDRIRAAYPVHPELFDRLYNDWSTLERFQRTRGVLRLMSTVIHELWSAGDASPLITPGAIPLQAPRVASELTNYLPDLWKPIIDADIDGEGSTPVRIDGSRPAFGQRSLTRRIARAIFIGSAATLATAHKGLERPRLWLGIAIPGDALGNYGAALEILTQQATYLYSENTRYWFSTTASVTRTAADIADRLRDDPERVWDEVIRRARLLAGDKGMFAGMHVAPTDSADIPDTDNARLVVVHPRWRHTRGQADSHAIKWAEDALLRVGSRQRRYRNMLVFLAADQARWDDLDAAARAFLAWDEVRRSSASLNLTQQQIDQADTRCRQADEDTTNRLQGTYTWALVPEQPVATAPPSLKAERVPETPASLPARVSDKLRRGGELATDYGSQGVRMALDGDLRTLWKRGPVRVGDLWSLYAQYPYLDRLRDRGVLERALLSTLSSFVWTLEGFALAQGYDEGAKRYVGLVLPGEGTGPVSVTDDWLVVKPDLAIAQRNAETDEPRITPQTGPVPTVHPGPVPPPGPTTAPAPAGITRYFGALTVDPERYGRDFARVAQEVLQHLAAVPGTELRVTVNVEAVNQAGFSADTVRTVRENADTLRFEANEFEAGG